MRTVLYSIALAVLLAVGQPASAAPQNGSSVIVVQSTGKHYDKVRQLLSRKIAVDNVIAIGPERLSAKSASAIEQIDERTIVVAIGTKPTRYLARTKPNAKVLSILVTEHSFKKATSSATKSNRFVGQFIDQPLERYIDLTRLLLPKAKAIASLATNSSAKLALQSSASACNLTLNTDSINARSNPIAVLNKLFDNSDAMILIPQLNPLNGSTAKWSLHIASRHRKPVIGFSEKFVAAGAMAAIYASAEDIALDAADTVSQWQLASIPAQTENHFGKRFTVKTNKNVAGFLGLTIPDSRDIENQLQRTQPACARQVAEQ